MGDKFCTLNPKNEEMSEAICIDDGYGNLIQDIVVLIAAFTAYRYPHSLTRLKHINKHWYQSLDPNRLDVNMIWENNICRIVFENIPKSLKIKRWDRFFQYRLYIIKQKSRRAYDPLNFQDTDKLYRHAQYRIIEGCDHDVESINSYHSFNKKRSDKETGLFIDKVDSKSGLPKGLKCKLKCSVIGIKLERRGWNQHYCKVCKKDVFHVADATEMKQKVNNCQYIRYIVY